MKKKLSERERDFNANVCLKLASIFLLVYILQSRIMQTYLSLCGSFTADETNCFVYMLVCQQVYSLSSSVSSENPSFIDSVGQSRFTVNSRWMAIVLTVFTASMNSEISPQQSRCMSFAQEFYSYAHPTVNEYSDVAPRKIYHEWCVTLKYFKPSVVCAYYFTEMFIYAY